MNVTNDYTEYAAKERAFEALSQEIRPANKTALFDALERAAVAKVVVTFDGSGDSGQIECIDGFGPNDSESPLPIRMIAYRAAVFGSADVAITELPVRKVLEHLAYDLLHETHEGWENNDGAYGEFTFDVGERTISLDFNERFTESTNYQHEF